jgi:hypothetical protein
MDRSLTHTNARGSSSTQQWRTNIETQGFPVTNAATTQTACTLHNRKWALYAVGEDAYPVGEGFPNRVSPYLLGKHRWRFK